MEFVETIDWTAFLELLGVIAAAILATWGGAEGVVAAVQRLKRRLGWSGNKARALAWAASFAIALATTLTANTIVPDVITTEWFVVLLIAVARSAEAIYMEIKADGERKAPQLRGFFVTWSVAPRVVALASHWLGFANSRGCAL